MWVVIALWPNRLRDRADRGVNVTTGTLKTRDWKTWDQIAGVEKTGLENTGPKRMGGIHGTGKRRTKIPGWKTHDHRLLNAKWISIKLKGTLYDMYIIL